jgi:hypothetical protein
MQNRTVVQSVRLKVIRAQAKDYPPMASCKLTPPSRGCPKGEIWQDRIAKVAFGQPVELTPPVPGTTLQGGGATICPTVGRQCLISDNAAEKATPQTRHKRQETHGTTRQKKRVTLTQALAYE